MAISGGLDSAALVCFTRATCPDLSLHLLHLYSSSVPVADERSKAIAVAEKAGLTIAFLDIDPHTYTNDLGCQFESISFTPTKSFLTLGLTHAMRRKFSDSGISELLSGDGGDQLFLRFRTPSLIKELVAEGGRSGRYVRHLADYAALNSESFWTISWDYLTGQTAARISNLYTARTPSVPFLNGAFCPIAGDAVVSGSTRPWRSESRKFQFFGLRDSELNDCDIAGVPVRERKPFLYWPLIKYCMSLRRSLHTHEGRDRALERAAFREFLPDVVYCSEAKGGADDPRNRFDHAQLADALLDGELVRRGLLEKDQLRNVENQAIRTDEACVLARATTIESWLNRVRARQHHLNENSGSSPSAGR